MSVWRQRFIADVCPYRGACACGKLATQTLVLVSRRKLGGGGRLRHTKDGVARIITDMCPPFARRARSADILPPCGVAQWPSHGTASCQGARMRCCSSTLRQQVVFMWCSRRLASSPSGQRDSLRLFEEMGTAVGKRLVFDGSRVVGGVEVRGLQVRC